ncbi:integrase core domain-containing protein [Streptomyces sp. NBC_01207]|uniref:integrase core domain-containing protein n=1 Tax=Streptomyces sp. NBC_01207 TaxID=2903772 RepID=UPI003FA36BAF
MNAAAEPRSATSRGHRNAPLTPKDVCAGVCGSTPDVRSRTSRARASGRTTSPGSGGRPRLPHGENGLLDHSSSPATSPARTPEDIADLVEALRQQTKHGPARLAADPQRLHGVGTESARASKRTGPGTGKVGYAYLHSALDDHSRLAHTEPLDDEKAVTAVAFWNRAVSFFAAHGSPRIRRCLTDNGACYRSTTWADALAATGTKHKRTRSYTPRTNGKVERHNGTLTRAWAYVRDYTTEHERRVALAEFVNHYNDERPHAALGGRPPVSRTAGSDYRIVFDQPPEPLADIPQRLTFEDFA